MPADKKFNSGAKGAGGSDMTAQRKQPPKFRSIELANKAVSDRDAQIETLSNALKAKGVADDVIKEMDEDYYDYQDADNDEEEEVMGVAGSANVGIADLEEELKEMKKFYEYKLSNACEQHSRQINGQLQGQLKSKRDLEVEIQELKAQIENLTTQLEAFKTQLDQANLPNGDHLHDKKALEASGEYQPSLIAHLLAVNNSQGAELSRQQEEIGQLRSWASLKDTELAVLRKKTR